MKCTANKTIYAINFGVNVNVDVDDDVDVDTAAAVNGLGTEDEAT